MKCETWARSEYTTENQIFEGKILQIFKFFLEKKAKGTEDKWRGTQKI